MYSNRTTKNQYLIINLQYIINIQSEIINKQYEIIKNQYTIYNISSIIKLQINPKVYYRNQLFLRFQSFDQPLTHFLILQQPVRLHKVFFSLFPIPAFISRIKGLFGGNFNAFFFALPVKPIKSLAQFILVFEPENRPLILDIGNRILI